MSTIRESLLRQIFNDSGIGEAFSSPNDINSHSCSPEPLPSARASGSETPSDPVGEDLESELSILAQQLSDAVDRLDVISASSFNISELVFTTSSGNNSASTPGSVLDADILVAALSPDTHSTQKFRSTVRALQFLERDLLELLDDSKLISNDLVSKCEDAIAKVNLELYRLLAAAQMHQGRQIVASQAHVRLGVRRIDLPRNAHPAHRLDPLTISVVIIISTIHCFMNISRENCDFIIRAMLAMLRVAFRTQKAQDVHMFRRIDRIPTTLETSLHYLDIHADLVFYAVCPVCSTLYPERNDIPKVCTATNIYNEICNTPLLLDKRRGKLSWQKPRRRYTHQLLEVWLSRFLNRPGIEDLIETVRPELQAECTDFWGAPYFNNFPGSGQTSFFDTPIENIRLAFLVYHDFFNPFGNSAGGKQCSIGVIKMACLNLPHEIRYNRENIYTVSVIPGPSEPSREQINHFMRPIAQDLKEHLNPGVWIARTHKFPNGRHVRSAPMVESMDLLASRSWCGLSPPTHTYLCSSCWVTQDEIDLFDKSHSPRTMHDHIQQVNLWMAAVTSEAREAVWKQYGARYSEWLTFPYWNPCATAIAPMHWGKNVLEKQIRENMGWSWTLPSGIPDAPKTSKSITTRELEWGEAALKYSTAAKLSNPKSGLTEPLLRFLCNERGIFNAGQPIRRMVADLNTWRLEQGLINPDGEPTTPLPAKWAGFDGVSVARADYYLGKAKQNPQYLVRNSYVDDLRVLCDKYKLTRDGLHLDLATRLIKHARTERNDEVTKSKLTSSVAVLGHEVMTEIRNDMDRTIYPCWLKAPPKKFGRISHGKIGAEEYKSLAMVPFTISLVRVWGQVDSIYYRYLNHFLHLMLAVRILAYQTITKEDIQCFREHYTIYLRDLKQLYPYSTIIPTQHLGIHIPEFLEKFGPATRFSENPAEMFIGMLQDIPTNWKFGELEYTLHREAVAASNLQALLLDPELADALGEVGGVVNEYLAARHPSDTGTYLQGWNATHPTTGSILSEDIFIQLTTLNMERNRHPPTRHQLMCSKVQNGHVIYQPEAKSLRNSQVIYEEPGARTWTPGRIESILLQSDKTGSHEPQLTFSVRPFNLLSNSDRNRDPYFNHPLIGTGGAQIVMLLYEELAPGPPVLIEPKDVVSHIATCQYHDLKNIFQAPCVVALSLNLKHSRPG